MKRFRIKGARRLRAQVFDETDDLRGDLNPPGGRAEMAARWLAYSYGCGPAKFAAFVHILKGQAYAHRND